MRGHLELDEEAEDLLERHGATAPAPLAVVGFVAVALGELAFAVHRGVALAPNFMPEPPCVKRCKPGAPPRRSTVAAGARSVLPPGCMPGVLELWAEFAKPLRSQLPTGTASRLPAAASSLAAAWAVVPAMALFSRRRQHAGPAGSEDGQVRSGLRRHMRIVRPATATADATEGTTAIDELSELATGIEAPQILAADAFAAAGGSRARRLKDMVYVKEMRAAITSGEFALRLRGAELPGVIDYQRLCNRLYTFADKLKRQPLDPEVLSPAEARGVLDTLTSTRARLEERLMHMTDGTTEGHEGSTPSHSAPAAATSSAAPAPPGGVDLPDPRQLLLYMREDKTVDFHFDDALTEANKAARFSRDLWERLNGRSLHERSAQALRVPEPSRVARRRRNLDEAKRLLEEALHRRAECLECVSGKEAGDRLSRFERARAELLECDQLVRERRCREVVANFDWLLERAAAVLEADLERASVAEWDVSGRQLKLLVVEFSLLEKQEMAYRQFIPEENRASCVDFTCILDFEELRVLQEDVAEFVTRLGLEVDSDEKKRFATAFQRWVAQSRITLEKMRTGVAFYVNGAQLLWQDLQYAGSLFTKAALSNYTLRPREVRTMQRTAKDVATFIPFLIILIIPLTPVGHVLVFSFIQKFFPDFFPSTFTERRQNVVKIYRDIVPETARGQ